MTQSAPLSASLVSKWFVARAQRSGEHDLDNLKLQKLLFLAESRYHHLSGRRLLREPFEAWKHGPVVQAVYREYSRYGRAPITEKLSNDGPWTALGFDAEMVLDEIWAAFGVYSGWRLRDITHENGPWEDVYQPDKRNLVIPAASIGAAWPEFAALEAEASKPVESSLAKYRAMTNPLGERAGNPSALLEELSRSDRMRREAASLLQ